MMKESELMKKTKEILGLPIISISNADNVGKVNNLIINAEKGSVDYILVETGEKTINSLIISTEDIIGVGEYAATIANEKVMVDISSVPEALELLQNNVQIKDTDILTKKGNLIGKTDDFYIDEEEFSISGLEFIDTAEENRGIKIILRKDAITFGKKLIIVEEDVIENLLNSEDDLASEEAENFFMNPMRKVL